VEIKKLEVKQGHHMMGFWTLNGLEETSLHNTTTTRINCGRVNTTSSVIFPINCLTCFTLQLPLRRMIGTRQPKANENAMSHHVLRLISKTTTTGYQGYHDASGPQ
jgi:hypothetical protein